MNDYYVIKTLDGRKIEGGAFPSEDAAIRWYKNDIWPGWLYRQYAGTFYPVNCEGKRWENSLS